MSGVTQSLLGFDASLRMLSGSARPDPRAAAVIRRSSGPTAHGSALSAGGKTAFHRFQTGVEQSDKLRSASRSATNPPLWCQRDLERLNGRHESRRSGIRAPATVVGGFASARAEKVRSKRSLSSCPSRKRGGGKKACCAHRARPGQKGKFTAKLTTKLRFQSRAELLRSSFTVRQADRLHLSLNSGQTMAAEWRNHVEKPFNREENVKSELIHLIYQTKWDKPSQAGETRHPTPWYLFEKSVLLPWLYNGRRPSTTAWRHGASGEQGSIVKNIS